MCVTDEMTKSACDAFSRMQGRQCLPESQNYEQFRAAMRSALETALAQQAGAVPEPMTHQKVDAIYQRAGEKLPFSARHFYCRGFNDCRDQIIASSAPGGGGESSKENDRD